MRKDEMNEKDENTFKDWNDIQLISQIILRARKNDPWDMIYEMKTFIAFAEDYFVTAPVLWDCKLLDLHLVYYERTKKLLPAYHFDIDRWRTFTKQPLQKHGIPYPQNVELVLTSLDRFVKYELKEGKLDVRNTMQRVLEKAVHEGFLEKPRSGYLDQFSTVRIYLAGQAEGLRKVIEEDLETFNMISTIDIFGEIPKKEWTLLRKRYSEIYPTLSDELEKRFWTRNRNRNQFLKNMLMDYKRLRKQGATSDQAYEELSQKYYLGIGTVKNYVSQAREKSQTPP